MQKILLVEDEVAIAVTVIYAFKTKGFAIKLHTLGKDMLTNLQKINN